MSSGLPSQSEYHRASESQIFENSKLKTKNSELPFVCVGSDRQVDTYDG
jgi:hypothetical protein